uniref:Uncharacterized protein n=1 Tax=Manihot esculenta TaxID=3983 RepID=A0A2C9UAI2_MANES
MDPLTPQIAKATHLSTLKMKAALKNKVHTYFQQPHRVSFSPILQAPLRIIVTHQIIPIILSFSRSFGSRTNSGGDLFSLINLFLGNYSLFFWLIY